MGLRSGGDRPVEPDQALTGVSRRLRGPLTSIPRPPWTTPTTRTPGRRSALTRPSPPGGRTGRGAEGPGVRLTPGSDRRRFFDSPLSGADAIAAIAARQSTRAAASCRSTSIASSRFAPLHAWQPALSLRICTRPHSRAVGPSSVSRLTVSGICAVWRLARRVRAATAKNTRVVSLRTGVQAISPGKHGRFS